MKDPRTAEGLPYEVTRPGPSRIPIGTADVDAVARAWGFWGGADHLDKVLDGQLPTALSDPRTFKPRSRRAERKS